MNIYVTQNKYGNDLTVKLEDNYLTSVFELNPDDQKELVEQIFNKTNDEEYLLKDIDKYKDLLAENEGLKVQLEET